MRIIGISLVANAVRLDFPIVPALKSVLPLCDEVIVNVGPSDDGTLDLVRSVGDPRVRVIHGVWDRSAGGGMLAVETQRALDAAKGDWAVYIQADEVLHEDGIPLIREALGTVNGERGVEGLLAEYVHFYGSFDTIGTNRRWYRREVRVVRLGSGVMSHGDAQGFRVGSERRRIRARRSGARMFHYGWARSPQALAAKRDAHAEIWGAKQDWASTGPLLRREYGLAPFRGAHPQVAAAWVRERMDQRTSLAEMRWNRDQIRFLVSDWIERLTGWEPFVHRNYVEV